MTVGQSAAELPNRETCPCRSDRLDKLNVSFVVLVYGGSAELVFIELAQPRGGLSSKETDHRDLTKTQDRSALGR